MLRPERDCIRVNNADALGSRRKRLTKAAKSQTSKDTKHAGCVRDTCGRVQAIFLARVPCACKHGNGGFQGAGRAFTERPVALLDLHGVRLRRLQHRDPRARAVPLDSLPTRRRQDCVRGCARRRPVGGAIVLPCQPLMCLPGSRRGAVVVELRRRARGGVRAAVCAAVGNPAA